MLSVYLCDDNKEELAHFVEIVENYILLSKYDMKLTLATNNPQELLDFLPSVSNVGLYFLDVDFGKNASLNGFSLGEKIRCYDPRCFIVFITSHGNLSNLTFQYQLEAMNYITKENPLEVRSKILQCLERANNLTFATPNNSDVFFKIRHHSRLKCINLKDILYIKTTEFPHQLSVITITGFFSFYSTLAECQQELNADFIRCHNSCLVNQNHISSINFQKRSLLMDNEDILPVSLKARKFLSQL